MADESDLIRFHHPECDSIEDADWECDCHVKLIDALRYDNSQLWVKMQRIKDIINDAFDNDN